MCGIAGQWRFAGEASDILDHQTGAMIDTLRLRGPDDRGVWVDPSPGLALANRRLAVVDLSPGGHQPMVSADGRVVIAFNGEIYNHAALRRDLTAAGTSLRSQSDTEVLLELIAARGLDAALAAAVGMYAVAVWLKESRTLHLVRDPFGEKPLYWTIQDGRLLFGSELKAMRAHPDFRAAVDPAQTAAFLRWGRVPSPGCILAGVRQVQPGGVVTVTADGGWTERRFWRHPGFDRTRPTPPDIDMAAATETIADLLRTSVGLRMVADVPVGVFLSGGIDSSLVAALAQAQSATPIRTFSIGFAEASHDESAAAEAVAGHLGTRHESLRVTAADALAVIPELPDVYDEPLADASQIPTLLLARLARSAVTVALTGDGGDELFAGYSRHAWARRLDAVRRSAPDALRGLAANLLTAMPPATYDRLFAALPGAPRQPGDKIHKVAGALGATTQARLYASIVAQWPDPPLAAPIAIEDRSFPDRQDALRAFMLADVEGYLPDGVLAKVDRATMAASLESRAPFLDPALAAAAWDLPDALLSHGGVGKTTLRTILSRHIPPALFDRPKSGFGIPLGDWLRGPLRPWFEDLATPAALENAGLAATPIRDAWRRHLAGTGNEEGRLWTIATFLAWHRRWVC